MSIPGPASSLHDASPPGKYPRRKTVPKRQQMFIPRKAVLIVTLIILVMGLINLAPLSSPPALAYSDEHFGKFNPANQEGVDDPYPFEEVSPAPASPPAIAAEPEPIVEPAVAPVEEAAPLTDQPIQHVVIISVDGMRPDAMELADTPNLDKLLAKGAFTPNAQTVSNSITLVSHASMLSGVLPAKHGIDWGIPYIGWPGMSSPTLFNLAHNAGLSTGMVFGKDKLNYLVFDNSVDELFGVDAHDPEIRDEAIEIIEKGLPNALFIHLPDNDRVGHAYGWMSENQFYAIQYADGIIGEIVAALKTNGYIDNTLLIILADHGGHGFTHGDDTPEDRTIPWLAVGPGVAQGVRISGAVSIMDTAATTLYALDVPIPDYWDGKPVLEIFE